MLSGNGRHRRPRQAPAILVAAGVTGSAIAIPLLGATVASAADGTTWDRVAECESGGAWSANEGNGYYGGLQLSQENWEEYGGLDYAPSADLASRSQQIAVAEKLLDDQGVGAWSTCGLLNGLSQDSASADVDTGVAGDSSDSSDSSSSSGLSDSSGKSSDTSSSSSDSSSDSPGASADAGSTGNSADNSTKSDKSPSSSESASTSTESAPQETDSSSTGATKGDESGNFEQSVGSSALVDTGALGTGRHRGASESRESYTVRAGDSLASIADSLDLDGGWRALYAANKKAIGSDPSHIFAGQTLDLGV